MVGPCHEFGEISSSEYGCSATCESAEKAKTTALAKERQTRLKHVKKMNAARRKALHTLQEVARKKNFQNLILLYIGVGRGCLGVGGNVGGLLNLGKSELKPKIPTLKNQLSM